jgi:hypothetical protein
VNDDLWYALWNGYLIHWYVQSRERLALLENPYHFDRGFTFFSYWHVYYPSQAAKRVLITISTQSAVIKLVKSDQPKSIAESLCSYKFNSKTNLLTQHVFNLTIFYCLSSNTQAIMRFKSADSASRSLNGVYSVQINML